MSCSCAGGRAEVNLEDIVGGAFSVEACLLFRVPATA